MKQPYILVAEDDDDDRVLIESAFQENGYGNVIKFVDNGAELVNYLKKAGADKPSTRNLPVFVLLDLNMPKKDGREALKEIKENKSLKKIPVIIFTTTRNEIEIAKCYELGANSYIVKPSLFKDLVATIQGLYSYWFKISSISA